MEVKDSIDDIPVQDPPGEEYSATDLTWTKFGTTEHHVDDVALIPYARVDAFISGECSNAECPTRFHIERGRKREKGSLKEYKSDEYLQYRLYWCSFGPENYGEGGSILPSRRYRLNTRNRAARPQSMRGCTCHFAVKRLYARPSVALIIYHERRHINKSGFICHGPLDRDAIGPGAKKIPYICGEIQQQTMSLIYLGIPEENVLQTHIEGVQRYCGSNAKVNSLASQYVQKLGMIIKRSTHELDLDDQASIRMWVEKNRKLVFFYQDSTEMDPFILGIQTEWQLQQMIRFGHQSLLASDSSFGISKLKYPLYTLLAFDSRQHALPVAWVITRTIAKQDVTKWMKALADRVRAVDSGFKIGGFIVDDPASEIDPIRDVFCCPVLFSLWRIRRSWHKNVVKKCSNIEVQQELFKRVGKIMDGVWSKADYMDALEELFQDFVDQTTFMQYFKACWVPKIEMWLATIRSFPLAGQESCCAIEGYHVKLKLKIYDDSHLGALQRVDWLVHKLTTELHSGYWLDLYADESGSFPAVKEEYISSTSWHRALQIADDAVAFDDKEHLFAKVVSQKDGSHTHIVWNPGSEFALCDCSWSMQGNLCKHIIKVNMMCRHRKEYQPALSYQSFEHVLLNLWRKPMDDSFSLDQSMAWARQMQEKIQRLVELTTSGDIAKVTKNLPLKWVCKRGRTFVGRPADGALALPPTSKIDAQKSAARKKNRKRKRLSRIRGSS
ncbi:L-ascorbate peroxidase 1, cytosolic [Cocos nucifera]|uniref:L-ascorbate peroxidase 1, cytosolic n=1 Tax=Cocos nucifera TaxID=13894 RepID=A0A8K0I796_COCNU|nr:L-ascorbate peroxidase 1, cytosolic [Cocos nucifera]